MSMLAKSLLVKEGRASLRSTWVHGICRAGLCALALLLATEVPAEDERPSEVPYETPGEIPSLDTSYRRRDHKVVIIRDNELLPKVVRLEQGQLVAWISYARAGSTIVFERETAKSMVCHSLVNFSIVEDELKSAPIRPGEFASFCELKPGRYSYKIIRRDPGASGALGTSRRLDGAIVVGETEGDPDEDL